MLPAVVPAGPDPNFPYSGGGIGVWGYDFFGNTLKDPRDYVDVMGYCEWVWVSDYYFNRATEHRLGGDGGYVYDSPTAASDPTGEMLVVRGRVVNGEITLGPAFIVTGPPALPESDGPYSVDGISVDEQTAFSLSFTPDSDGVRRRRLRLPGTVRARMGRDAPPDGPDRARGYRHGNPHQFGSDGSGHRPFERADPGHHQGLGRRVCAG